MIWVLSATIWPGTIWPWNEVTRYHVICWTWCKQEETHWSWQIQRREHCLKGAKFPVSKRESIVKPWEWDAKEHENNCQTPVKFWGIYGTKKTPEFSANHFPENRPVTKQTILSYFGAVYDPLGIGKRKACLSTRLWWEGDIEMQKSLAKTFGRPCSLLGQGE